MESVPNLDEKSQILLDTLKRVAARTLDRKRRLGQYAVLWKDGKVVLEGEDAPDITPKPKAGNARGSLQHTKALEPISDEESMLDAINREN